LPDNLALEILIWIALAFGAGFVGYFGRNLAKAIVVKIRRRKVNEVPDEMPVNIIAAAESDNSAKYEQKMEKQRLKLEKKKIKKGN
jgi:hypothetical protein